MANKIDLKLVKDILACKFYIPSYQRGYRWNKQQVIDLLEDIWEFSQKEGIIKEQSYCLQPIVVKKMAEKEDKWEVIDGQQRLTTIYIILTYIKQNVFPKAANVFSLEFETRKGSELFLKDFDGEKQYENIDYYHIFSALQNVTEWFESKGDDETAVATEIYNKLLYQCKFIWYEVDNTVDPIDIFTRINLGKISLTNSELIKALFLQKNNIGSEAGKEKIHLKQLEIANEWDQIEYSLQNDEFWYFIYNGEKKYETRIEFIFDLMSRAINKTFEAPISEKYNVYFSFLVFSKLFKQEERQIKEEKMPYDKSPIDKLWLQIKKYFMTFEEWFSNRIFYHMIGYLVAVDVEIGEIKKETEAMTKSEQIEYFNSRIRKSISSKEDIGEWNYRNDSKKIKNVLLLFNIISLISNEKSNIRFQFDRYKIEDWDIEHIHAVNSEMPNDTKHRLDWLKAAQDGIDDEILAEKIKVFLQNNLISDNSAFEELYDEIITKYGDNEDINDISNLTLLDAATNRSYKNSVFPIKRRIILKNDREGTFIPICTKNVFLKYYSELIDNMTFWNKADREDYLKAIKETLKIYLPVRGE